MKEYVGFISNMYEVCIDENQPIVRCCDCINYFQGDVGDDWCIWWGDVCPSGDGFCSWGERESNEQS